MSRGALLKLFLIFHSHVSFYSDLHILILNYLGHFFFPSDHHNHLPIKSNLFYLFHILYIYLLFSIPTGTHLVQVFIRFRLYYCDSLLPVLDCLWITYLLKFIPGICSYSIRVRHFFLDATIKLYSNPLNSSTLNVC